MRKLCTYLFGLLFVVMGSSIVHVKIVHAKTVQAKIVQAKEEKVIAIQNWQAMNEMIRKSEKDTRQYQAIKLKNNMQVLLVSDKDAPKSLAALALPIGSLDDPESQQGLAHYLEHMVLMGSKHYPKPDDFSEFLNKNAGSYNASTASYRTSFYLEVDNNAFTSAVDRLAGAIAEPLLDPLYSDRERNAVNAELTLARSRDGLRIGQVDGETINPAHPRSRFFGGNLEMLSDKPGSKLHDEMLAFYKKYYSANLFVGVLYSNQPLEQMAKIAAESFGRIENRYAIIPQINEPIVREQDKGIIIHYVPAQPFKLLKIDFKVTNNQGDFRSKTDTYISYLLGNRSENTLSDWLQKQGLAEHVGASVIPYSDRNTGMISIMISLTDKGLAERDKVIAAFFAYLKLIKEQGIKQHYFDELAHVLNLDFQYQSINRNMGYVEDLSETLLFTPIEHVLDSAHIADRYNPVAIAARLDELKPEDARIWYISPNEPHDKKAYFVDAPYQVRPIAAEQLQSWQKGESAAELSLPELNPYIPDDLSLIKPAINVAKKPQWVVQENKVRALYMASQYFADEPKADVTVVLRSPLSTGDAKNQVLFSLNEYLASLALAKLSYQAEIGGIYFSIDQNCGLSVNAFGFTQRLPLLMNKILTEYRDFVPTDEQLVQAKISYLDILDGADKDPAFKLAMQPLSALSHSPFTERDERRKIINEISLVDVIEYRKALIKSAKPELLVVGNLTPIQVKSLAKDIVDTLQPEGETWWHGHTVYFNETIRATINNYAQSTDSALVAAYFPNGYSRLQSMARSRLLVKILHSWFYNQLRTEEQLGYALFATTVNLGQQFGLGFILQSGEKTPDYLYSRYQSFYLQAEQKLKTMDAATYEQYKKGLISELEQRPQTLSGEANAFINDFNRSNYAFDSKEKLIEEIKKLSQVEIIAYFKQAVVEQQGFSLLSQVLGEQKADTHFASPKDWQYYENASGLQKKLSVRAVD